MFFIENGNIRIEVSQEKDDFIERFRAKDAGGDWRLIASSCEGSSIGSVNIEEVEGKLLKGSLNSILLQNEEIVEEFTIAGMKVTRRLGIENEADGWIKVNTCLDPAGCIAIHSFYDKYRFGHDQHWSYAPSVMGFIPDAQYKAPVIMLQSYRSDAFAIVPDVIKLDRSTLQHCNHSMELDVREGTSLSAGYVPGHLYVHSVYCEDRKRLWEPEQMVENPYYIFISAREVTKEAYRKTVRFHWKKFGMLEQTRAAYQQKGTDKENRTCELWDSWRYYVWEEKSARDWLDITLPDGSTGGAVRMKRWGGEPSIYFTSWFNSMRTSFGMALYARRSGNDLLLGKAVCTLRLVTKSPGFDGAFKCFVVARQDGTLEWGAGDGQGNSTKNGYLGYDMCWTGYWLLQWYKADLPEKVAALDKCLKLADFMIKRQDSCGMFNTFFDEAGNVRKQKSDMVPAETGPVALFLLELYSIMPDNFYLEAALRALEFLENEVVPTRQWYDFETFCSCSYMGTKQFDMITGQYPANNLALIQTADAFQVAHTVTGNPHFLETGLKLLDYLLLYQQCWTNPVIEDLSCDTMLLGGFTTQNTDAEWSDARQSQAGTTILNYYRKTGNPEYLQRGVAALRAQFPVSPSENWAHSGYGKKAGASSFHWGTGSGMAGIEIEQEFLMDAVVDISSCGGVGVNGLNLYGLNLKGNKLEFNLSSPFAWKRDADIKFYNVKAEYKYEIIVNERNIGMFSGRELLNGLQIPVKQQYERTLP